MQSQDEMDSVKANQSVFSLLLWGLYICSWLLCTSKAGGVPGWQLVDLKQPYAPLAIMSVHYGGFFTTKSHWARNKKRISFLGDGKHPLLCVFTNVLSFISLNAQRSTVYKENRKQAKTHFYIQTFPHPTHWGYFVPIFNLQSWLKWRVPESARNEWHESRATQL